MISMSLGKKIRSNHSIVKKKLRKESLEQAAAAAKGAEACTRVVTKPQLREQNMQAHCT